MTLDALRTQTWRDWLWLHPLERIAPTYTARTRDLYVVGGQYTRTLVLAEPPPDVAALWLVPLLDLGGDVTISQQIVPLTAGETKRLLRLRRTQHLSDMLGREKQGRLDDPDDAAHFNSATQVEQHVVAGTSRLFHVAITLTLRAPAIYALASLEGRVRDSLERLGATCWPATWEHAAGFQDGAPLMRRALGRTRTFDTTTLAYSFLFAASNVGMPAGPVWGVSTQDGRPLRYDPWNRALGVEAPHVAILAPTGCVAGETLLDGPDGARPIKELAEAGNPVRVWSLAPDGRVVAAQATAPFLKGVAPLYEFVLEDGRRITVTGHHRFLTPDGWQHASALHAGGRVAVGAALSPVYAPDLGSAPPRRRAAHSSTRAVYSPTAPAPHPERCACGRLPSTKASVQRVRGADAQHWNQTPQGSLDGCSADHRLGGEQPPLVQETDQVPVPSRGGVLARSHAGWRADGRADGQAHNRAYQASRPLSTSRFSPPLTHAKTSTGGQRDEWQRAARPGHTQDVPQSLAGSTPAQPSAVSHPSAVSSVAAFPYPSNRIGYSTIISRRYVRTDAYYDLHVPHYENYLAHGIWNHNTGKTVLAWHLVCESLCGGAGTDGAPARVILVDPKADYTRGVRYFGGTTLQWHVHAPAGEAHTINVMQIGAGQTLDEAAKATLGLVALATSTPHYPMAPDTTGIWEAAIRAAYAEYGITPDDARTWHTRPDGTPRTPADFPTLATLYGSVAPGGAWDTPTLANALYPWARGTFAPLFARPTSVDLAATRIISFDLESLSHDQDAAGRLRAVASYLIGTWTWALAKATPGRTLLVLDEVETLLAYPETALLVGNWLALGRSYGLQVVHMSQQYLGYTQTPQGRRAISNTPTKVFLQQAGGENIAQITADFGLTAAQRQCLLTARKGVPGQFGSEALLVTPRGMEQIEIVPPPEVLNVLATGDPAGMHPAVRAVLDEAATVVAAA